ncbi:hypothetical protein CPB84DRAFT_1852976 [Gymnopilus junonius]|uniref:Uncharacterized protein n=1 Tax=Gymnopilus junonius TaxID=109634 RepID=A0A9P5N9E3_GYMJU|nr:hypothetical protein CPB84DRAFT_1852976 [Gymnopilus junonius]
MAPRLAKLSPTLPAMHADSGPPDQNEQNEVWQAAAKNTVLYDTFFQYKNPAIPSYQENFQSEGDYYVIGFEGWARRELDPEADELKYVQTFYFRADTQGCDILAMEKKGRSFGLISRQEKLCPGLRDKPILHGRRVHSPGTSQILLCTHKA